MRSAKTDRVTVAAEVVKVEIGAPALISPSRLSDAELVAEISGSSVEEVEYVLDFVQGIGGLVGLSNSELRAYGMSSEATAAVTAATELFLRVARCEMEHGDALNNPDAVARYLFLRYRRPVQEVMGAVFVNQRNRVLADREFFRGTLTRAAVEPRPILREALQRGAAGVILFHTHPSGDPEPSAEDMAFTKRLAEAGEIVGVQLVDHLILGSPSRWMSMRMRGW